MQKAGAQKYAAEHGILVVAPDTSPRMCLLIIMRIHRTRFNVNRDAFYLM